MASKSRKTKIFGALVIAGVLIAVGYISSSPTFSLASLLAPATANAESTQSLLQEYAEKTGPDGVPLWEQQLIDESSSTPLTNATTSVSLDTSLAGAQAAPDSLTDQFAQSLFSQYMTQYGGSTPSDQEIDTYAEQAIEQVVADHEHTDAYAQNQIIVQGSGSDALHSYAQNVSKVFAENTVPEEKTEIDYFSDAVEKNDTSAPPHILTIGNEYTAYATALVRVPVPSEAATADLGLVNALSALGVDITDMSTIDTDPLRAYIGFQQYEGDVQKLTQSDALLYQVFSAEGVSVPMGDSGYLFYKTASVAETVENAQPTASST